LPYPLGEAGRPLTSAHLPYDTYFVQRPPRKFRDRLWLHVTLFLVTLLFTTAVGALHYLSYVSEFSRRPVELSWGSLIDGLWYSVTLLAILGSHEFGHYYYCRRYDVDASLPYFIPAPIPLTGTLGAVIKIREPFPNRTALFDIGVGGPIAGFIVLIPALFIGMSMSTLVPEPTGQGVFYMGEPLLFKAAAALQFGSVPDGMTINIHPMVFAAWFGMLATALNLLPFGQLDGGHITYATLGRWSTPISMATVGLAIVMTYNSSSWMFMTLMMLVMLLLLGPRHPRVIYEHEPLAPGRRFVAFLALVIFIVCFTPVPLEPLIGN
jgi:membrane-associated protease RseP (regulator of RpoE activity)